MQISYSGSSSYLYGGYNHYTHFTGFMLEEEIGASLWVSGLQEPKNAQNDRRHEHLGRELQGGREDNSFMFQFIKERAFLY
jgi:hypothetical protein